MMGASLRDPQPVEYEPSEMARRASLTMGSNALHRALWREHPRRMRLLFIAGRCEAPREIVIVEKPVPAVEIYGKEQPADLPLPAGRPRIGIALDLIDRVAAGFGITHGELIGESRTTRLVAARAVVARVLRDRGWSTTQIGRWLRRDHSTIIHLLSNWPKWHDAVPEAAACYARELRL